MSKLFENDLKKVFKILLILFFLFFIGYLVLKKNIFFSLTIGVFASILANYMLYYTIFNILYYRSDKKSIYLNYILRYIVYGLALYLVYSITKSILMFLITAISFFSFQILMLIYQLRKE